MRPRHTRNAHRRTREASGPLLSDYWIAITITMSQISDARRSSDPWKITGPHVVSVRKRAYTICLQVFLVLPLLRILRRDAAQLATCTTIPQGFSEYPKPLRNVVLLAKATGSSETLLARHEISGSMLNFLSRAQSTCTSHHFLQFNLIVEELINHDRPTCSSTTDFLPCLALKRPCRL
jgi:hypothetical protein